KRASTADESPHVWKRDPIQTMYPSRDWAWSGEECQQYIGSLNKEVAIPSACILCPFMNDIELLYLYRFQRSWFNKWVVLEANKIKASNHLPPEKNLGVWGRKLLPQKLEEVQEKHGHM